MENRAFGALVTALLFCCAYASAARAEPLRVLYAEPFQAQTLRTPGAQKPGPANLRVQAFGRTFELQLEDNSRLLRKASTQARQRIGSIQLLKGTVKDAPGSWVRLTLDEGRYSGAFWDGSELYAISRREELEAALLTPMSAGTTGIYRLSDTQGGLFDGTCAVAGSAPSSAGPIAKFKSLINELRASADSAFAAGATREIEISMIGDFEFTSQFGSSAITAMLGRMNVVDGIFSSQVGVATIPTDFITFASNTDPFTSTEPSTLLNQLSDYRNTTPVVRNRGLAHLLTGRRLDGNIIGIAFLSSVCSARNGAGLSEVSFFIDSPLVMAHEIGHNFGAPHDGEAGSPCSSMPQTFLMAPELNGSSQFSSCSLQQIQTRIQSASCIVTARNRDVGVTVPAEEIQTVVGQPFDYVVDVTSLGEADALNSVLTVQTGGANVSSLSMPDATCTQEFGLVSCQLSTLAATQTRRLTARMTFDTSGDFFLGSTVTSTGDSNSANDSRTVHVHVARETEVSLRATPQPLTVTTGDTFEMIYEVTASGTLPLNDMNANVFHALLTATSVSTDSGTCVIEYPQSIQCQLGTIPAGATRHIHVQWTTSNFVGQFAGFVRAVSGSDTSVGRYINFDVNVRAARDVALSAPVTFKRVAVGTDVGWSVDVRSQGVNAVDNVRVRLSATAGVTLAVDPPLDASCTDVGGGSLECALGSMAPQATRTIDFRASASAPTNAIIQAQVVLPTQDDVPVNDSVSMAFDVRVGDEVAVQASAPFSTYDQRPAQIFANVFASGANDSVDVQMDLTLPAGFVVQFASLGSEPCTIPSATPHLVHCSIPRIASADATFLNLQYVAPEPGHYTGTITVSAAADTDPSNNSQTLTFDILPNIDARVTAPAPPQGSRVDVPVELVFTIDTNRYALPDPRIEFSWYGTVDFSASASGATCAVTPGGYSCEWDSLPANTTVQVLVRVHSSVRTSPSINAFLYSSNESDYSNNNAFVSFPIFVPGDMTLNVTQPTGTQLSDQVFTIPGVDMVVLSQVEDSFIDVRFDAGRLDILGVSNASCVLLSTAWRCFFYDVQAPGTYHFNLQVIARGAGPLPITLRAGASNDFNSANDEQTLTLTIVDPTPPPPPPPSSGGGGGGGGGGSMNLLFAALLLLVWHHRRARFRVHS